MTLRQHHDTDAEASILGGVFLRPELMRRLRQELEVLDFASNFHQAVWVAMVGCTEQGIPIDPVTVASELRRTGKAAAFSKYADANTAEGTGEIDALAFCGLLAAKVPSAENVMAYAATVKRHAVMRDLRRSLAACMEAVDSPDNADDDAMTGEAAVQWCLGRLRQVKVERVNDGTIPVAQLVRDRLREYEALAAARLSDKSATIGIPTGVASLDAEMGGYLPGLTVVIAGRPGMGKSSVLRAAADACSRLKIGAHTISVEDTRARFADRVIASESSVPIEALRNGDLNRGQQSNLTPAIGRLFSRKHWQVSDGAMTARQAVACWRRHGEANETKLVAVDYLQRLKKSDWRMSDFDHVTEAMTVMADAAKEDGVVLLVGSQLNREVEKRDDKRPMMADLRAGGTIEEIAKFIIGVYRGAAYGPPDEAADFGGTDDEWAKRMELIVLKNNDGPAPVRVVAKWDGPTTTVA